MGESRGAIAFVSNGLTVFLVDQTRKVRVTGLADFDALCQRGESLTGITGQANVTAQVFEAFSWHDAESWAAADNDRVTDGADAVNDLFAVRQGPDSVQVAVVAQVSDRHSNHLWLELFDCGFDVSQMVIGKHEV